MIPFVRKKYVFVRVDPKIAALAALAAMALTALGSWLLIAAGMVHTVYASPFVAASAVVANRVCIRSGMATAALSSAIHQYLFVPPVFVITMPTRDELIGYASCFVVAYLVARRASADRDRPSAPSKGLLPFVSPPNNVDRSFWIGGGYNDWIRDCDVGTAYGRRYLETLRSTPPTPPLGWIIRDMVALGRWTGVEAGFCSAIDKALPVSVRVRAPPISPRYDDAHEFNGD